MSDDAAEATQPPADETDETDAVDETDEMEATETLADRVAAYDADLAAEVENLEADLREAREEVEALEGRLKRKQADFQNYKKRAKKRQAQLEARATEDLVERLVGVRDNLLRALDQDEGVDIREGVEATLAEFDRVLEAENVSEIDPEPGAEVDPMRHEVMLRVESDRPEGTVAEVYQPGYEMAEKVIQAAQVTVSDGTGGDADEDAA